MTGWRTVSSTCTEWQDVIICMCLSGVRPVHRGVCSCCHWLHETTRTTPWKNVLDSNFALSALLCFTVQVHAVPTSGSESTFIFKSLSFSVLRSATWSLPLRTAGWEELDSSYWYAWHGSTQWVNSWLHWKSGHLCSLLELGVFPLRWSTWDDHRRLPLFWMLVLWGQCTRPPVQGRDSLVFS